jgi:hypothetical protein
MGNDSWLDSDDKAKALEFKSSSIEIRVNSEDKAYGQSNP